jgi:hypothetical protein
MADLSDVEHLVGLSQRLNDLAADVIETYEPAAKRLNCFLLVHHLQSFVRSVDSGTARSLIVTLGKCLEERS